MKGIILYNYINYKIIPFTNEKLKLFSKYILAKFFKYRLLKRNIFLSRQFFNTNNLKITNDNHDNLNINELKKDITNNDNFEVPHWINVNDKIFNSNIKRNDELEENKKENKDKEYLCISKRSKTIKYIIRLRKKRNFRNKMNCFFIKNSKTLLYLLKHNETLSFQIVLSNNKNILEQFKTKTNKLYYVDNDLLNYIFKDSLNVNNNYNQNDSIAILKIPTMQTKIENAKFILAFDRIRYAYNLGNILKIAYSMNVDCLFYFENTVDPFNYKIIQMTNGSHLSIPYIYGSNEDLQNICEKNNLMPLVAHINGINPKNIFKDKNQKGICLILSNESTGPNLSILKYAKPISLPMHEMTNSLNVAAAASILIHFLKNI